MDRPDQGGGLEARLRVLQIIIVALLNGVILLAAVAIVLHAQGVAPFTPNSQVISYIALGQAVLILMVRSVVLPAVETGARKRLVAARGKIGSGLLGLFATRTILGAALLESVAFMFLIAYMVEGPVWTLAGGLVFAALIAALHFPTRDRVERWIERQRDALELERVGG
jgi:hypothetical protein